MSTATKTVTNGVSFGVVYTVTAEDATDGYVLFDFTGVDYNLAAAIMVLDASGVMQDSDLAVTRPAVGQVRIADGSTLALTAGQVIHLICQRDVG